MKRNIIVALCLLFNLSLMAQSVVKESLTFTSSLLKKEVRYSIYLPEDYNTSERRYPVLYLLHGWSDNETSWLQMGNMKTIVDETIAAGKAVNMIVVMPNADITWYANSYDGKEPYEDMFFQELIPYMDKNYRTRPEQQYRAVAGLSMGGYGSFLYSVHHPEYFSSCAPLSAAIYTDEMMKEMTNPADGFGAVYGPGNVTKHWHNNSLLEIMKTIPVKSFKGLKFYMDCGDDDDLLYGNMMLHQIMFERDINHEFRVRDGGHSWTYWRTALPSVLEFISQRFNRS